MEFIVSSKNLATVLSRIDFENDNVNSVSYDLLTSTLTIKTNLTSVDMKVTMLDRPIITVMNQSNRRWDWLRKLCMSVEEQPIIIRISEMTLKITFEY
jgi:hypothetical protein